MRLSLLLFTSVLVSAQSGDWLLTTISFGAPQYQRLELKVDGEKVTGRSGNLTIEGTLRNGRIELEGKRPNGSIAGKLSGTLDGDTMKGEGTRGDTPVTWTARRFKTAAPQTRRFEPTEFHNYFSSTIPPALTIFPGDTVESWSVDSGGGDAQGKRRSNGGNPLTGPFYVEGVMPGDTLVVHFTRLRLTRDSAESGDRITPSALDPFEKPAKEAPNFDSNWTLDRQAGFARLTKPTQKLAAYRVPLKPMLGCVGVAPPQQQSIRSGWLGPYGGNMDFNELVEGVTVYLPVFHPGALLFIGDGHAAQGDGELTGDALETSTEWTITVDFRKDKSIRLPRFENAEYWMASGIANSLPEAVQYATSNLSGWLEDEYGLNASEIAVVLGTGVHYEIAELVDPQVHVVAKIAKSMLAPIPK